MIEVKEQLEQGFTDLLKLASLIEIDKELIKIANGGK